MDTIQIHTLTQKTVRSLPSRIAIPRQLDSFRVLRTLGSGGSAHVLLAEETAGHLRGQQFALKVATPDPLGANAQMLHVESELLQAMRHPNVLHCYARKEYQGHHFSILKYVDGWSLKQVIRKGGKMPLSVCIDIGLTLCDALTYVHEHNVVHCDIKPSNVLIDRFGTVTLIDFGIAQFPSRRHPQDQTSGTVAYMAPEQATGAAVDARADLFSLAVMLYEMATGTRLYPGSDVTTLLRERVCPVHLPKTGRVHGLLGAPLHPLMSALQHAIALNPDHRYASAEDFRHALLGCKRKLWAKTHRRQWVRTVMNRVEYS